MNLKILTYNILQGGVGRESLIAEVIEVVQPDLVLLQELKGSALLGQLAERFGFYHFFAKANLQALRHPGGRISGGRHHIGLLSRFPITYAASYHPFVIRRTLLAARVEYRPGQELSLYGIHLQSSLAVSTELWRCLEVETILRYVKRQHGTSCIIAGDFNTVNTHDPVLTENFPPAMKAGLALQGGKIYRWALPRMTKVGFVDCFRSLHPASPGFTLPPPQPNTRLDYIFATPDLASRLRSCDVVSVPAAVLQASDHYPVVANFEVDG